MNGFTRSLAIVIGINKHQDGITRIKTVVPDVVAIARILQDSSPYQLVHLSSGIDAIGDRLKSLFTKVLPKRSKPT